MDLFRKQSADEEVMCVGHKEHGKLFFWPRTASNSIPHGL